MPVVVALGEWAGARLRAIKVQDGLVDARPGLGGFFIDPREHVGAPGTVGGHRRVSHAFQVAEEIWADGFNHGQSCLRETTVTGGKEIASILTHRWQQTSMSGLP